MTLRLLALYVIATDFAVQQARKVKQAVMLATMFAFVGCAGTTAITVAGQTVMGVADGYAEAKKLWFARCYPGSPTYIEQHFTVEQCQTWYDLTVDADPTLKLAAETWDVAAEQSDPTKRMDAEQRIYALLPRLIPLVQQVGVTIKAYTGGKP